MYQQLLLIARELAGREVGRPRKESLARAISSAYYALFHAVAEFCGRELVGVWAPWEPFRHVYRSLDHGPSITWATFNFRCQNALNSRTFDSAVTSEELDRFFVYSVSARVYCM